MSLFNVVNDQAQFDAASNVSSDVHGAGIRFTQAGAARVTTSAGTFFNQGIPMSASGQVAIVDATAGLPADTTYLNGLPISGNRVCVSRNASSVVSNGLPFDSNGAIAGAINFDLNFIGTDTLDPQVTFTRASTATFVGSNGLIQSAANDVPRFDYDPVTLAAKGLLIEESRANLSLYSEALTTSPWIAAVNVTWAQDKTSPTGATTAWSGIENTATAQRFNRQDITATVTNTHTISVFAKPLGAGSKRWLGLRLADAATSATNYCGCTFDVESGTFAGLVNVGAASGASAAITPAGNGWYRCTLSGIANASGTSIRFVIGISNSSTSSLPSYTGDGTSGLQLWGAQLEVGAFATSYIPTIAASVTRAADVATINTLSPWFNATEGTLYGEATPINVTGNTPVVFRADDGTNDNTISTFLGTSFQFNARQAASAQAQIDLGNPVANVTGKVAGAYKAGDFAAAYNGTAADETSLPEIVPTVTLFRLGASNINVNNLWLRRVTYYPRRLTNAELQSITA